MNFIVHVFCSLSMAHIILGASIGDLQQRISIVLENNHELKSQRNDDIYALRLQQFRDYVKEFNKEYTTDSELEYRFKAFLQNMEVKEHFENGEQGSAEYGFTDYSDMTAKEIRRLSGACTKNMHKNPIETTEESLQLIENGNQFIYEELANVESDHNHVDWRKMKFVSQVLDQGYCSSSWAYAATTSLETTLAVKNNKFQRLSKQQLIDCDRYNGGCCGGIPHYSFFYLYYNGGMELDKTYNGRKFVQRCHYNSANAKVYIRGIALFTNTSVETNEELMEKYVSSQGALAVVINADGLFHYKKGIIKQRNAKCISDADYIYHSVALVGYGQEGTLKYWIAKNSWGRKWGESGYFRLAKGVNMCGVGNYATAAIL